MGFDQIYLDPYTGEKVGSRNSSHSLIPFLFNLHYGMTFGNRGVRLFGFISLLWTITSIIGIYLTFPLQRRRSKASEQTKDTPKPPGRSLIFSIHLTYPEEYALLPGFLFGTFCVIRLFSSYPERAGTVRHRGGC